MPGKVILLNGVPRAGKSSIAEAIDRQQPGRWLNFGVDVFVREIIPEELRPGIGLRPPVPGDEETGTRLGPYVAPLYRVFHDSIAAMARDGYDVVVDVGYHNAYAEPERDARERLRGLEVLFVGVRCPLDVIITRRNVDYPGRQYAKATDGEIPPAILRWQEEAHRGRKYDLEVDTAALSPDECARIILDRVARGHPYSFDPK